jgi:hypothetical protein
VTNHAAAQTQRGQTAAKFEIRNPKSETNSKLKIQMSQTTLNKTRRGDAIVVFVSSL